MPKAVLGRGLGAILEEVEEAYRQDAGLGESIREISLSQISPNPLQPRKQFDNASLQELSESIKRHGLLQPVIVIKNGDAFILIAGERRFRASKLAGLQTIKAIIADIDRTRIRELALIENIQRENLNAVELANSLKELIEEHHITHEQLADFVKKSRSFITNTLRLLSLTPYVKEKIEQNKISYGHAKVLVGLEDAEQIKITDSIIGQKLNVRDTEELVSRLKRKPTALSQNQTQSRRLQLDELQSLLANTFSLDIKKNGSSITIKFPEQKNVDQLLQCIKNSKTNF